MGMKLLWVDDDKYFIRRYVERLEDNGFDVLHESDATSGLGTFEERSESIDAVIVDMAMPHGECFSSLESRGGYYSGFSLARKVHFRKSNIPIIAFCHYPDDDSRAWFKDKGLPYLLKESTTTQQLVEVVKRAINPRHELTLKTFIVHGHDDNTLFKLKNYIQNTLGLGEPIILREKPSSGMTIIEKFEEYTRDITVVFILMTPDDPGSHDNDVRRARQNVIFELGFFYAKMQRREGRVILLHKGKLEIPSDITGIVYIDISGGINAAGEEIRRELAEWLVPLQKPGRIA